MKEIVNKNKHYILLVLLILVCIFAVNQYFDLRTAEKIANERKETIITNDSIPRKVVDGQYQKLVNDMAKSQRELMSILKQQNGQLYKEIREQRKQLIAVINTQQSFENKTDTVFVDKTDGSFVDHYPNKEDWFIEYESTKISDDLRKGDWSFSDLNLDLVVSEKTKGIFEVDIKGPSFLKVNTLEVNSLPLSNIKKDNFGWLMGGGINYNPASRETEVEVSGGLRWKKTSILLKGTTERKIGLGVIKEF